jgi:arginine decarboxylase
MPTYHDHMRPQVSPSGQLNDFISLRDNRVIFGESLDLLALVQQYGAPLEISYCPQITRRIHAMQGYFETARAQLGYPGAFLYAYATKANFAEEVVRTAVLSGAHYETSSAFDVRIAHSLWASGVLPSDRMIFCNGSKEPAYIQAILALRTAGFKNIMPILDDPEEFEALAACPEPLLLGLRERKDSEDLAEGATYGYDRFGMVPEEMVALARRVAETPHQIVLYHAMVGSQLEDHDFWLKELRESLDAYAQVHAVAPTLNTFNFGGGMPTAAYSLGFSFDYVSAAREIMQVIGDGCIERGVPAPNLVGEFGRYTVADHGVHIFSVGRTKRGHPGMPPWYLINGSLMVALPDILIVEGQEFITLPLNHWDREAGPVVLGGRRTCDSDDFFPREGAPPLILPLLDEQTNRAEPLLLAFFGTGAYQAMLSGEGGAHHCLAPEAPKLIIEAEGDTLVHRLIGEQSWEDVLGELGYPVKS